MIGDVFALRGPAGVLDAVLNLPPIHPAHAAAVFCHPHPQYGGNFDNGVVLRVAQTLCASGVAVLRFNFRGVGRSTGRYDEGWGEDEDLRAAITALAAHFPALPLWVGGFSFGAARAASVGWTDPRARRLLLVAAAVERLPREPVAKPILFVHGGADEHLPVAPVRELAAALGPQVTLAEVAGADHFFGGALDALAERVSTWLDVSK